VPRLSIPERYRVGVAGLAALPDGVFSDFLAAVERGLSAQNADAIAGELQKQVDSLRDQVELSKVIAAVASMQETYHRAHVAPEAFGKDVADALSADAPSLAKKIATNVLTERVINIAEAKRIELMDEKIRSLQAEVEREYCCGRILTDVRAAFSDDPVIPPSVMTILHTLRIGYINDTAEHREFYVALENADLVDLKDQIERALTKGKTLEALLAKANCRLSE